MLDKLNFICYISKALEVCNILICECAGTGRQARLRGVCCMTYGFKSRHSHQSLNLRNPLNRGFLRFFFCLKMGLGVCLVFIARYCASRSANRWDWRGFFCSLRICPFPFQCLRNHKESQSLLTYTALLRYSVVRKE